MTETKIDFGYMDLGISGEKWIPMYIESILAIQSMLRTVHSRTISTLAWENVNNLLLTLPKMKEWAYFKRLMMSEDRNHNSY